MLRSVLKRE